MSSLFTNKIYINIVNSGALAKLYENVHGSVCVEIIKHVPIRILTATEVSAGEVFKKVIYYMLINNKTIKYTT
jgi:hypothetical protein